MLAILDADKSVVLKLSNLTTQHPVWKSHPKDVSRGCNMFPLTAATQLRSSEVRR